MNKAVGIAGTVAAAALLLTACGSDGGDDKKDTSKDPSSASSAPAEGGADAKVSGTYVAKSGDEAVILSISEQAVLMAGKHICNGEYADMGGKMLMLKCADGNTERSAGKVTLGADGKTLTGRLDALAKNDTFVKATSPSDLPSGLPTSLPSGIPTDLPSGIPTHLPTG